MIYKKSLLLFSFFLCTYTVEAKPVPELTGNAFLQRLLLDFKTCTYSRSVLY